MMTLRNMRENGVRSLTQFLRAFRLGIFLSAADAASPSW
jgi:hypothetical protein